MSNLTDKILKSIKSNAYASIMSESKLLNDKNTDLADTGIPMLNVALSGKWNGGIGSGLTVLAGPSKMGKSYIGLVIVRAFLNKYPDSVCVFLDSEMGSNTNYFQKLSIDMERVVHIPVINVENLKFESVKILEEVSEDDRVIFYLDSIGNLASKKEMEDAINEKSVADMSRAKQLKSYTRIIQPYLNIKKIPFIAINHTYDTMSGLVTQQVMGGGAGITYCADTVLFLGKEQDKDGTDLSGFIFKLRVNKSRFVKEKSCFCLNSTFEEGIDVYSDLFDFALETGFILSPTKGFYQVVSDKYGSDKKFRRKEAERNPNFWKPFIEDPDFISAYEKKYGL